MTIEQVAIAFSGATGGHYIASRGDVAYDGFVDSGHMIALPVYVKPKPKPVRPKVGDKISGLQIRRTQWKAGTVVALDGFNDYRMLNADGLWFLADFGMQSVDFDYFSRSDEPMYTLIHDAGR